MALASQEKMAKVDRQISAICRRFPEFAGDCRDLPQISAICRTAPQIHCYD
jgi:hypothetical protein